MPRRLVLTVISAALITAACKPPAAPAPTPVNWEFDGTAWKPSSTPPNCASPFPVASPVDLAKATHVLYPGQTRGGHYKAHGGFRFEGSANDAVAVTAPFAGQLVRAARYLEAGEEQVLLDIVHPCGIMVRFDHLRVLDPTIAGYLKSLPAPTDSSATTRVGPFDLKAGQRLATSVGFVSNANVSVDFGLYDLRKKNSPSADPAWAAAHSPEQTHYAVCWFDWLNATDEARVRSLPAGDMNAGSTSDYCSA